jgi:hypothetical protein
MRSVELMYGEDKDKNVGSTRPHTWVRVCVETLQDDIPRLVSAFAPTLWLCVERTTFHTEFLSDASSDERCDAVVRVHTVAR